MSHIEFHRDQIFHRLPEALCQTLFDHGETQSVPAGEVIVSEGDELHHLYIVVDGRTEALLPKTGPRVSSVRLSVLGPGDCFGEYAFVDQQPASATIRAISNAEVLRIRYEDLRAFLETHHTAASVIYQNLMHILVRRLRMTNAELDLFTLSFSGETSGIPLSGTGISQAVHSLDGLPHERPVAIGQLVDQFFHAIRNGDISQLPLADGATYHGNMLPEGAVGADAVRSYMSGTAPFIKSFRLEDTVIESSSAAVLVRYEGINDVHFEGCYFMDFENDQIARIRTVFDSQPLMKGGFGN